MGVELFGGDTAEAGEVGKRRGEVHITGAGSEDFVGVRENKLAFTAGKCEILLTYESE